MSPRKRTFLNLFFKIKYMFEDDGITFRHEVECVKKKRKAWKKKKGKA